MTALLEVKNLQVRVEEREILHGLSLTVNKGEVHAIMGPNGSGKSTLSHVIAGKPGYEVTGGEILFNGEDLLAMSPDERAAKGVFLAFQYPGGDPRRRHDEFPAHRAERAAQGARRGRVFHAGFPEEGARGRRELNIPAGHAAPWRQCRLLRRREEAQRSVCKWRCSSRACASSTRWIPASISTRCAVAADGVNALRSPDRAMVVITHYQRLLNYIVPDFVHVMSRGRVVKSGDKELALELEASGYAQFEDAA